MAPPGELGSGQLRLVGGSQSSPGSTMLLLHIAVGVVVVVADVFDGVAATAGELKRRPSRKE